MVDLNRQLQSRQQVFPFRLVVAIAFMAISIASGVSGMSSTREAARRRGRRAGVSSVIASFPAPSELCSMTAG
jgi:hypothetical protein